LARSDDQKATEKGRLKMIEVSIFNDLVSKDLDDALTLLQSWEQKWVDLRENIFGETVIDDIDDEQLAILVAKLKHYQFKIGCLGTRRLVASYGSGEKELKVLQNLIRTAMAVRTDIIRVCTEDRTKDLRRRAEDVKATVPNMRQLCDLAAEYHLTLALENKPRSITNRGCELREMVEMVNRPNLKVVWDAVNSWQGGLYDVANDYQQIKEIVAIVHLRGAVGQPNQPTVYDHSEVLGDDQFPSSKIISRLVADGYNGRITLDLSTGSIPRFRCSQLSGSEIAQLSLKRMQAMIIDKVKEEKRCS
jgi:sugar phosphate isomerase/epimerase